MKGLILSGGTGSRMMPLTAQCPKQMLPINNKPILCYLIEMFKDAGIDEIVIVVGDTYPKIQKIIGDGSQWGVKVQYKYQSLPLGLAHCVKISQELLGAEDFVMALGDNFLNSLNLREVIASHYENQNQATLLLKSVKEPQRYGIAYLENQRIIKVVEKPQQSTSNLAILGLYVFDHRKIYGAIERIKPSKRNELEITDAIQQLMLEGGAVGYYQMHEPWLDIGTPIDLFEANVQQLQLLKPQVLAEVGEDSQISGRVRIDQGVKISNSHIAGPALIGQGAVIINSTIGSNTVIGAGCHVVNSHIGDSLLLENTYIYDQSTDMAGYIFGENSIIQVKDKSELKK